MKTITRYLTIALKTIGNFIIAYGKYHTPNPDGTCPHCTPDRPRTSWSCWHR